MFGDFQYFDYLKHKFAIFCPKNQIQLGKNCSMKDFNFFSNHLVLVSDTQSTIHHGLSISVLVGPAQDRCVLGSIPGNLLCDCMKYMYTIGRESGPV